jgi:hypothetical protein
MAGLGEIAADQLLLPYDEVDEALLCLGRHLGAFEDRHDHRGVHVEGERGRGAALRQGLERDRVAEQPDPCPAPRLRHVQLEKPRLAQPRVVLGRVAGVAVVLRRAGREIRGQREAALLQMLVLVGDREVHGRRASLLAGAHSSE